MLCIWKSIKINKWICIRCGAVRINQTLPKRECDSDIFNCKYFAANELRKESCSSCNGSVSIKIYACSIHGECCLSDKLDGIKNCNTCENFEAKK